MKRLLLALFALGALAVTASTAKADHCRPYAPGYAYRPVYGGYAQTHQYRAYRAPHYDGYRAAHYHRQTHRRPDYGYGRAGIADYGRADYGRAHYRGGGYGRGVYGQGYGQGQVNIGYRSNGVHFRLGF